MAPPGFKGDRWTVAALAALPGFTALAVFGVLEPPDSGDYMRYAAQLLAGPLPRGASLLSQSPAPVSLYRTAGYPAVIAAAQWLFGEGWRTPLVLAQIGAQAGVAAAAYAVAIALGLHRSLAIAAALAPTVGLAVVMQISVLGDALYGALFTGAALLLLRAALGHGRLALPLLAGALLALAMLVREATLFIALGFLPAAWVAAGAGRRVRYLLAVLLPIAAVATAMAASNFARSGHFILSTIPQVVMVQALLPLTRQGLPVYDGDDLFDRTARETVGYGEYASISVLHDRLFAAGMTGPAMAREATRRYLRAWLRFPAAMLSSTCANFRLKFLALPFSPVDTIAMLAVYAAKPRPDLSRFDRLAAGAAAGSASATAWLVLFALTRLLGFAAGVAAIVAPFVLWHRGDPRWGPLLATWCICVACVAVYLPVHLDVRYLVPVVPLLCLLAAAATESLLAPFTPLARTGGGSPAG